MAIYSNKDVHRAIERAKKRVEGQEQVVDVSERLLREYKEDLLILEKHQLNR